MAKYLRLAKDAQKSSGLGRVLSGDALQFRDTARSIAKRVLTLSFGLGIGLGGGARALFPLLLPAVCQSAEVANLVSNVREMGELS